MRAVIHMGNWATHHRAHAAAMAEGLARHGIVAGFGSRNHPEPCDVAIVWGARQSQILAAEAWGARRTWFLVNGASQGNHAACLALAHIGARVVVQRNVHSSVIDGMVMSGLRPSFVAPELDPELGITHCLTPGALASALDGAPDAVAAMVVSPTGSPRPWMSGSGTHASFTRRNCSTW